MSKSGIWIQELVTICLVLGSCFIELDKSVTDLVKFGDASLVKVAGRGTLLITAHDGSRRCLFYTLVKKNNIVSLG